jgi:hypothetical protein
MSVEYRPVPAIPFHLIDKRLEKHGVKVEFHGDVAALIGRGGTLFAALEGDCTHFERKLGVDARDVMEAIEAEYGVRVVDESDHRFWGCADDDDQFAAVHAYRSSNRSWILIEGPSLDGVQFVCDWVEAARAADEALQEYFQENLVDEHVERFDFADLFEFVPCALAFLCWWTNEKGVFAINLSESVHTETVIVMAAAGFLTRIDQHYRMTIPQRCEPSVLLDALRKLVETPFLTTMTGEEIWVRKARLTGTTRQADRNSGLRKIRLVCSMGRKIQSDE